MHNRWHPLIAPSVRVSTGDILTLDVPDGASGQVTETAIRSGLSQVDLELVHPLVGPIYVEDAEPGDRLEVEIRRIEPGDFGWTGIFRMPGGLFGHMVDEPVLVPWELGGDGARTDLLPDVLLPPAPNVGVIGVAPSQELLERISAREERLARAGWVHRPSPVGAVPATEALAAQGLRTLAAREIGGNLDVAQLGEGCRVVLPVLVEGALLSLGDVHFSQGDGECFGTGLETDARVTICTRLQKGAGPLRSPRFVRDPESAAAGALVTTTGLALDSYQDLTLALQDAVEGMLGYLKEERGLSRLQAQLLVNVAVRLNVSVINNPPSPVVAASLPLDVFLAEALTACCLRETSYGEAAVTGDDRARHGSRPAG